MYVLSQCCQSITCRLAIRGVFSVRHLRLAFLLHLSTFRLPPRRHENPLIKNLPQTFSAYEQWKVTRRWHPLRCVTVVGIRQNDSIGSVAPPTMCPGGRYQTEWFDRIGSYEFLCFEMLAWSLVPLPLSFLVPYISLQKQQTIVRATQDKS